MRGRTITFTVTDKRGKTSKTIPLYQYDYGQKLVFEGVELPEYYEVHFSNQMNGEAVTVLGDSTGVLIPDTLLETGDPIYVWLFLHDSSYDGETEYQGVIPIIKRAEPTDVTPTPEEQSIITEVIAALNNMEDDMSEQVEAAQAAKEAAETAQTAAEAASATAVSASDAAGTAQTAAETAQGAAETAQAAAEAAQTAAESAYANADDARNDAVAAKIDAVAASTTAVSAKDTAVSSSGTAVNAANSAEEYKTGAEAAQTAAETAQGLAETAQAAAEAAESDAEAGALEAEGYALGKQSGNDVDSSSPYYHNNAKYYATQASDSATAAASSESDAEDSAEDAEAYAVGKRNGVDVDSDDPAYHNNAKYYADAMVGKADLVSDAVEGNLAGLDSDGNLTDSGSKPSDFLTEHQDISGKLDAPSTAGTQGQVLTSNGEGGQTWADPSGAIDDTAGEGDTDVTWSADKLADEFGDVLNAIQSMQPAATNADIGKALLVKTVADGKPTSWEYGAAGGGSVDPSVIAEAVEDWCDENITSDPTVVIDTSLLVSGAAADSKAVGLKVKHNDDELKMQSSIDDLLAIATKYNDKKIDESGAMVSGGNFDTYEVAYDGTYTTFSATLYSNTNYNTRAISFINSSSQVISVLQYPSPSNSDPQEFINQTIPSGTAKILICNKFKINEPLVTYPTTHSKRLSDIETINSVAGDALNRLNRNLLDETKLISGKGLNDSGEAAAVTGRELTDFIPVEASTFYVYQNAEADYSKVKIAFYTAADEETFINGSIVKQFEKPIKSPVTAQYCRIADGYEVTRQQFEKGEIKTDYHPYNYGTMVQENVIEDKIDIILPERLYAVANQEMNLYFANILEKDWTKYEIECECGNAAQLTRRLVWNNQAVEREFGIKVTKDKTTAERILELKITDASAMTHKSVLIIGDSTTSSNTVVEKLHADINNESLIDTVGTQGTAPYNHEGRSGWSISSYCSNTTGNPFWNPTSEKFDASYYFTQNNISYPDFFIIALGINDIFQMPESQFDARLEMLDGMVSSVKEASSNIGVCLSLVLPPHDQDSFGIDYPARYKNAITQYRRRWAKWNRMLIDNYDHRESEGIYVIPINMNLDTVYGMNRTEQFVNARSAIKEMRSSSGSGVHPIDSGYWQIADVYWAFLCYMSSLET